MSKILFVYETEMPTVSIVKEWWSNISDVYNIHSRFIKLIDVKRNDLNWCNVLILIRPNNSLSWRIALSAKMSGRFVITMCDDDLMHLPETHPDLPWRKNGFIKALNYSSVIMSNSKYLINQMKEYTADNRGVLVDTVVKATELVKRYYNKTNKVVKIVYAAGAGQHEKDFEEFVLPALENIGLKYPNSFSITFIAVHPNCGNLSKYAQVNYIRGMSLLEYRKYMEKNEFDIGLAPLEGNNFTKCKYYNKYLEYTFTGIAGIYSNEEPYTFVVHDGINGWLCDNNIKAWEDKLILAIQNPMLRITCAQNAQEHVCNTFTEHNIMERLLSDIPELYSNDGNVSNCKGFYLSRIFYIFLNYIEYIYKTVFYLKKQGIVTVIRKIKFRLVKDL